MSDQTNDVQKTKMDEMTEDFVALAELTKYPPFSVESDLRGVLFNMMKEFEDFANDRKPYDSFEAFQNSLEEQFTNARAWSGIYPDYKQAATEYFTRLAKRIKPKAEDEEISKMVGVFISRDWQNPPSGKITPWGVLDQQ